VAAGGGADQDRERNFEGLLREGTVRDYAELARLGVWATAAAARAMSMGIDRMNDRG